MNTKTAIGLVAAVIIIGIAFFVFQKPAVEPVALPVATTTPQATTGTTTEVAPATVAPASPSSGFAVSKKAAPSVTSAPAQVQSTPKVVTVDQASLTSNSDHPMITGTANVKMVAIVIDNPQGVGIAGSWEIPVENGKWTYPVPVSLKPGTYTIHVLGGDKQLDAKLVVTQ